MPDIKLPNICGWCESPNVTKTRAFSKSWNTGANQLRIISLQVPICNACDAYTKTIEKFENFVRIAPWFVIMFFFYLLQEIDVYMAVIVAVVGSIFSLFAAYHPDRIIMFLTKYKMPQNYVGRKYHTRNPGVIEYSSAVRFHHKHFSDEVARLNMK